MPLENSHIPRNYKSEKRNLEIDSALILAGFTVTLYCIYTAYYQGYLKTLGLDPDIIEKGFHQIIYEGFLITYDKILYLIPFTLGSLYIFAYGLLPYIFEKITEQLLGRKKTLTQIEIKFRNLFKFIFSLFFIAIVFICCLAYYENKGKSKAKELIAQINQNTVTDFVNVKINDSFKSLIFLGCGENNCVGLEDKTKLIYYFPISNNPSFKFRPLIKN